MRELQFHKTYLRIAKEIATLSRANRRKVGALIVKDNNILSFGFNGTPYKLPNKCEDANGETLNWVVHGEINAIGKIARSTNSTEGAIMYLTFSPCMECSKLIIQSGIKEVYYIDQHSNIEGLTLLKSAGIAIKQISLVDTEKWKTIKEFPMYKASTLGRIYSLHTHKFLSFGDNGNGYLVVSLGRKKMRYVHKLVAETFLDNIKDKQQVHHKDGNKSNNAITNLEWVTAIENMHHYFSINPYYGIRKVVDTWCCKIIYNGKRYYKGKFKTKEEAYEYKKELLKQIKEI